MTKRTFVESWLAGDAGVEAIEDWVKAWHEGEGGDSLPAFLGFTDDEYALWVERPRSLPVLLTARRRGERVFDLEAMPATARAAYPEELEEVLKWLREREAARS